MKTVQNPHDTLFREIYTRKEDAQSFLEHYLPQEVLQYIDPSSLAICKDSFIDEDLKDYYSDLLYTVTLHGQPGYVYVLFEHKSYPDRLIHLQLLEYMVKIWRLYLKQRANTDQKGTSVRLPLILPLVLYHGENSWPYSIRFSDMLNGPKKEKELAAYIPDFSHLLTDLTVYSDNEIKGTILSRVMLLLFKHIFAPDLHYKLPEILTLMNDVSQQKQGSRTLELFIRYLCNATDTISSEELFTMARESINVPEGERVMTIAEQLRHEGYERAMKEVGNIQENLREKMKKDILERLREEMRQEIQEQVRETIWKEERQKVMIIGKILLAQTIMDLMIYEEKELEQKSLDDLQSLLAKMEAHIKKLNIQADETATRLQDEKNDLSPPNRET